VLLFCVHDGRTRDSLVLIILSVAGCDDPQAQGAVRQWSESDRPINRAFRRFELLITTVQTPPIPVVPRIWARQTGQLS
jgi:hypothetical protein